MMKCITDLYECDCECHNTEEDMITLMSHCMPCCEYCKLCGKYIIYGLFNDHVEEEHWKNKET